MLREEPSTRPYRNGQYYIGEVADAREKNSRVQWRQALTCARLCSRERDPIDIGRRTSR